MAIAPILPHMSAVASAFARGGQGWGWENEMTKLLENLIFIIHVVSNTLRCDRFRSLVTFQHLAILLAQSASLTLSQQFLRDTLGFVIEEAVGRFQ